jgi:hypothetical protein
MTGSLPAGGALHVRTSKTTLPPSCPGYPAHRRALTLALLNKTLSLLEYHVLST